MTDERATFRKYHFLLFHEPISPILLIVVARGPQSAL